MTSKTEGRYRVEVRADSSGEWAGNALRFDAPEEAEAYGVDLAGRWMLVRAARWVDQETGNERVFYGQA